MTRVLLEQHPEGIAHVVLDGPATLNAQTPTTWHDLAQVAADLPRDTRVVVLRGAGRAFSSGLDRAAFADLAELRGLGEADLDRRVAAFQAAFTCWRPPGVLSVAAVHGAAVGAGFQLALACDLRVAAQSARFRMAETSLGLVPDLAGTGPLVRAVGEATAIELCLTGRTVGAEEALGIGLVQAVVPDAELSQATADLLGAVLQSGPAAVAATLDLLRGAATREPDEQRARERAAQITLLRARTAAGTASAVTAAEGTGVDGR